MPAIATHPIVDSYIIDSLKRKARTARIQAGRASPALEMQLKSLAELYESDIDRLMRLQYAITISGRGRAHSRSMVTL